MCISNQLELAFHLLIASPNFFINNVLLCANSIDKKKVFWNLQMSGISFYKHKISIITSTVMEVSASTSVIMRILILERCYWYHS